MTLKYILKSKNLAQMFIFAHHGQSKIYLTLSFVAMVYFSRRNDSKGNTQNVTIVL